RGPCRPGDHPAVDPGLCLRLVLGVPKGYREGLDSARGFPPRPLTAAMRPRCDTASSGWGGRREDAILSIVQVWTSESSGNDDKRCPSGGSGRLGRGAPHTAPRLECVPAPRAARRRDPRDREPARRRLRPAALRAQRQRPLHVPSRDAGPRHLSGGGARRCQRPALVRRGARHRPGPLLARDPRSPRLPPGGHRLDRARHARRRGPRRGRRGRRRGGGEARGLRHRHHPGLPLPHLRDRAQRPVPPRGAPRAPAHPGHRHVRLARHRPGGRGRDPGHRAPALCGRLARDGRPLPARVPPPGAAQRRLARDRLLLHLAARADQRGGHPVLPRRRRAASHPLLGPVDRRRDQLAAGGPCLPAVPRRRAVPGHLPVQHPRRHPPRRPRPAGRPLMIPALQRVGRSLGVLLVVVGLTFAIFYLAPIDPALQMCGKPCSPEDLEAARGFMGFDQPWWRQLATFLGAIFTGRTVGSADVVGECAAPCLGYSFQLHQSVTALVGDRFPISFSIAIGAVAFQALFGIAAGAIAARRQGGTLDRVVTGVSVIAASAPAFVVGLLVVVVFALRLDLLPSGGYVPFSEGPLQWARHLVLPWATLAFLNGAIYARLVRSSMIEQLGLDYVRTARATGLSERRIDRYALRNLALPLTTLIALDIGALLGGTVITERIFGQPGLGALLLDATATADLP